MGNDQGCCSQHINPLPVPDYRTLHSSTDPARSLRTVISVAGTRGSRVYRMEHYRLPHPSALGTDAPCISRAYGTNGEHFPYATEAEAQQALAPPPPGFPGGNDGLSPIGQTSTEDC